uniref:Calmodulin n=1 Tax=Strigamia maritima TaxID=126957 RepID=T1JIW0_STRMM
ERRKSLKRTKSLKSFTEERKRDIHQAFRLLDENQDGLINFFEVKTMMEKLGFPATDEEVSYILQKLGKQVSKPVLEKAVSGCVKWFNVKNGYGFITRHDNGNDVFVHNTAIAANSSNTIGKWRWRGLADGEIVHFDVVVGKKGLEAANVTGPNGAPVRGSLFARDRPRHRKNRSDKQRWPVYTSLERENRHPYQANGADITVPQSGLPPSSSRRYLSRRRPLMQSSDRSSSESETGTSPSRCSNASTDSSSSGDVGGSGDGLISEEEFYMFMNQFSGEDDLMEELKTAFKVFDKDGNGFITREELKRAMDMIGEQMSEKALDDLLSTVDVNKDGKIDYNGTKQIIVDLSEISTIFFIVEFAKMLL